MYIYPLLKDYKIHYTFTCLNTQIIIYNRTTIICHSSFFGVSLAPILILSEKYVIMVPIKLEVQLDWCFQNNVMARNIEYFKGNQLSFTWKFAILIFRQLKITGKKLKLLQTYVIVIII